MKKLFVCLFLLSLYHSLKAKSVEDGFEALKIYNYFEAKRIFEKKISKNESPCAYGLAIIYFRKDNPFSNLDSAFRMILRAENTFPNTSEKLRKRLALYHFTPLDMLELKRNISSLYFKRATEAHSEQAYHQFVNDHPWANERFTAIARRDSIAFYQAMLINTPESFSAFLNRYPDSEFRQLAQREIDLLIYKRETSNHSLEAYLNFSQNYPTNHHVQDAERQIFQIQTELNTVNACYQFILNFPNNRYVPDAWRKLFQLYMYSYSANRINEFKTEYPDYPFQQELDAELEKNNQVLLPFVKEGRFGWMNGQGQRVFEASYELLKPHQEGLAIAAVGGKIGFVDKANQVVIAFEYDEASDFEDGRAIVEKNGKVGIIDRTGQIIFELVFDDIGLFSEGLIYAKKDSLFGYYDRFGKQIIPESFDEAFSFQQDMAQVVKGDYQNYINRVGTPQFPMRYERMIRLNDTLFVFYENGMAGLITSSQIIIQEARYQEIATISDDYIAFILNDKIGFFNLNGKIAIAPQFDYVPNFARFVSFTGGYARVKYKNKFGVIDKTGKWVIPALFTDLGSISDLMAFKKDLLWGYMDLKQKVVIPATYDQAFSFDHAAAIVSLNERYGLVNANGITVLPTQYEMIDRLTDRLYAVSGPNGKALVNEEGSFLSDQKFKQIRLFDKDYVILYESDGIQYYHIRENRLIKLAE